MVQWCADDGLVSDSISRGGKGEDHISGCDTPKLLTRGGDLEGLIQHGERAGRRWKDGRGREKKIKKMQSRRGGVDNLVCWFHGESKESRGKMTICKCERVDKGNGKSR